MMKQIPIVLTVARIKTQKTVSHEFQRFWKHLFSVEYNATIFKAFLWSFSLCFVFFKERVFFLVFIYCFFFKKKSYFDQVTPSVQGGAATKLLETHDQPVRLRPHHYYQHKVFSISICI